MAGEQAPALTYDAEAPVVVVVESHVATRPSPDLQAAPAEGLWLLPADTLSRRLAAQLAMEGDDAVQLEQAVERNDAKEILILVLASEARRQHSLEPPDAVAQELGAATDGGKDGQNPKVETVPEPACWKKLRGVDSYTPAAIPKASHILGTGLTSFFGLGLLSLVHFVLTGSSHYTLLLGSFGANAVLMFAAPAAPFSQPRNVMYGHLIGAVCGVAAQQWVTMPMDTPLVGAPLAVAVAIMLMAATGTTHPPAGGTACIAAMALEGSDMAELGWGMVLTAEIGAALLVLAALLLNNLLPDRRYPQGWS